MAAFREHTANNTLTRPLTQNYFYKRLSRRQTSSVTLLTIQINCTRSISPHKTVHLSRKVPLAIFYPARAAASKANSLSGECCSEACTSLFANSMTNSKVKFEEATEVCGGMRMLLKSDTLVLRQRCLT